ncbi:hypothetical protein PV963_40175 [Streptomyces coeruleorubidus]|uniref:hypothetical protein n=1 Tax=Streptomyces coeruleorubidus TaxID=116188 RepID=UPI00237F608A|nr:hypothetical protein [Streptomyces coeruleorubidus]WDV56118.1 hypothetical protein PV963_40175 [Streptomyces coeruleorubidus]
MHVITVHLKSKIPSEIPAQMIDPKKDIWRTADSWAEGRFLSSMKRMRQALEVRRLIDHMLVTRNLLAHYRGSEIHNEILLHFD